MKVFTTDGHIKENNNTPIKGLPVSDCFGKPISYGFSTNLVDSWYDDSIEKLVDMQIQYTGYDEWI